MNTLLSIVKAITSLNKRGVIMQAKVAFDSVCAKVAEKYKDMGWRYAKSKHWMSKKDKNFTYKVLFYTSWYNRSDESVAFYGAFGIYSNKSKQCFTALSTEKCNIPEGRLEWNVAKEDTWDETVEEFTNWFDNMGLPMIEECTNNLDEYVKKVAKEGFYPWRGYVINIDFVLQFGSRELAEEAAKRYYDSLTETEKTSFKKNYESMINGGGDVDGYGSFQMLNPSDFRTIIENKLMIDLN